MNQKSIPLLIHDTSVGDIIFDESPNSLELIRTAYGPTLRIPTLIVLRWNDRTQPCPVLANLRVVISMDTSRGERIELTRARDDEVYFGTSSAKDHPEGAELLWTNLVPALVAVKQEYSQSVPLLNFQVRCELYLLVRVIAEAPRDVILVNQSSSSVLSYPHRIRQTVTIKYSDDVWNSMIQAAF